MTESGTKHVIANEMIPTLVGRMECGNPKRDYASHLYQRMEIASLHLQ